MSACDMRVFVPISATLCAVLLLASSSFAVEVAPAERGKKTEWVQNRLVSDLVPPPFSFKLGEEDSDQFLTGWKRSTETDKLDASRTQHTLTWTSPEGLVIKLTSVDYAVFPVLQWKVAFTNSGPTDTPPISDVQVFDLRFEAKSFILHGNLGAIGSAESFQPFQKKIPSDTTFVFPEPGTAAKQGWPYFNVELPGSGLIFWLDAQDSWKISFSRDKARGLTIRAGLDSQVLSLKPGETFETPSITLLFWQGDDIRRAQNLWRRWSLANHPEKNPAAEPSPPEALQCQTYGLSDWKPSPRPVTPSDDPYSRRSALLWLAENPGPTEEAALAAPILREGDYYPLTEYTLEDDQWIGWQFDRPESGDGIVQMFRRKNSPLDSATYPLRGLEGAKTYEVKNFDEPGTVELTGRELMETGLPIRIPSQPGAVTFFYKKK